MHIYMYVYANIFLKNKTKIHALYYKSFFIIIINLIRINTILYRREKKINSFFNFMNHVYNI